MMSRKEFFMYAFGTFAIVVLVLLLGGCTDPAKPRLEPEVRVVEVKVATPVPCPALERLGPEPVYPDTPEAIASAATIGEVAALYAAGRVLRVQRLAEYAVAKTSCIF